MLRPVLLRAACLTVLLCAATTASAEENWPQFRGPQGLGVSDNPNLPDTWSATENIVWKRDIAGRGWSSPIVWGKRIFVTTVVNQGQADKKESSRGLYLGGNRTKPPQTVHEWRVLCIDFDSGEVLWDQLAHQGLPRESVHLKNTFASETPTTDGQRVYAYFGNLGLYCYDLDGKLLWSREMGPYKTAAGWGTGSSPVVHDGRLFILNDNEQESFLMALDAKTGEELWRTPRQDGSSWSTPYIWQHAGRTEIVVSGSGTVRSYDLEGQPLWQLGDMSSNAIPTPFAGPELLYVGSGYFMGNKKPVMAVRPGAVGDITLAPKETSNPFVAWCQRMAAPYNPSMLLYHDYLYVVNDLGIVSCYDAKTGESAYGKKRLPNGRAFTTSPWAYNGKVFFLNEYGDTFVVKAGPEYELLHTNSIGEDEMCLATPAIVGDKLLLRSDHRLYQIGKAAKASP